MESSMMDTEGTLTPNRVLQPRAMWGRSFVGVATLTSKTPT